MLFKTIAFATTLSFAQSAPADTYRFTVSDQNIGNIVLVKNCLDYQLLGNSGNMLAGGDPNFRMHLDINLSKLQLNQVLSSCNLANLGTQVSIRNNTTNTDVSIEGVQTGINIQDLYPVIYIKDTTLEVKQKNTNAVQAFIDQKDFQGAVDFILNLYSLSTEGYAIIFAGDMGAAGAVTDHSLRTVTISKGAFDHPCVLIQTVRHELEHIAQIKMLNKSYALQKNHNFSDHFQRERSAYLNDIRNIPHFCASPYVSSLLVNGMIEAFLKRYSRQ